MFKPVEEGSHGYSHHECRPLREQEADVGEDLPGVLLQGVQHLQPLLARLEGGGHYVRHILGSQAVPFSQGRWR